MEGPGGIITGNILYASAEPVRGERPHRERERPCMNTLKLVRMSINCLGLAQERPWLVAYLHSCSILLYTTTAIYSVETIDIGWDCLYQGQSFQNHPGLENSKLAVHVNTKLEILLIVMAVIHAYCTESSLSSGGWICMESEPTWRKPILMTKNFLNYYNFLSFLGWAMLTWWSIGGKNK